MGLYTGKLNAYKYSRLKERKQEDYPWSWEMKNGHGAAWDLDRVWATSRTTASAADCWTIGMAPCKKGIFNILKRVETDQ